ncbi:MAG TPA: TylF/MycF/NovP-related O-methyltransferase [Candidatus Thalassarchaeaceae archaeon]|jgi:hypothetical protein|nr:TylF/MycF/NovP-related O-methyltransferase [Candidatus Thalassarchaeaceae archaeon]HJL64799.1 TylF/MycF/NovP-related O-methyltransferase [Candidatus Thalassarchaeaceae archaeon]HJO42909.1 TylF/MycF/NovP-related O-methyltransferase [Candidatus Thalassarchaeaceae archaeon]
MGYKIVKIEDNDPVIDEDSVFLSIYQKCKDKTMTSKERMFALHESIKYIINNEIPGDFVECGVWKGGSTMMIAQTLLEMGVSDRTIYLYDTFEGMTKPTEFDNRVSDEEVNVLKNWKSKQKDEHNEWCFASLSEVKENMYSTSYPQENLIFVKGDVVKTIPESIPETVSLLRLDTDWYESTLHELNHLFPVLSNSGVLIIDDYGHWSGSKKAVDEYFSGGQILLNRIDYSGRIGIKIGN